MNSDLQQDKTVTQRPCIVVANNSPTNEPNQKSEANSKATGVPIKSSSSPSSSSSSSSSASNVSTKSHKIEGKNKKSLHHKQQQQQQQNQVSMSHQQRASQQQQQPQTQQQLTSQQQQPTSNSNSRRSHQKNGPNGACKTHQSNTTPGRFEQVNICSTLDEFSKRAQELKADINSALEKQTIHQNTDQPIEVVKLKEDILKLSGLEAKKGDEDNVVDGIEKSGNAVSGCEAETKESDKSPTKNLRPEEEAVCSKDNQIDAIKDNQPAADSCPTSGSVSIGSADQSQTLIDDTKSSQGVENHNNIDNSNHNNVNTNSSHKETGGELKEGETKNDNKVVGFKSDLNLTQAIHKLKVDVQSAATPKDSPSRNSNKTTSKKRPVSSQPDAADSLTPTHNNLQKNDQIISDEFEPLNAQLDVDSKFIALKSSLQKHFNETPHLLEPICWKLVNMSEQNGQLMKNCEKYQSDNQKLTLVKQKLENLCRELQKSNNAIRIESLDLIKVEQGKAKEQTTKIQSTLSGVIKLFDENQQRNMSLRQENQELQTKLKSLLDHCDNWEKSVEAALRQRDIENRLIKTELAKANLLKNEEKEKFLGEKQELLQILSMMQEQQHRIEGQEAKLRSDLSSYASKYDECQAVISKGMNKFQTESKKMLKQIERSKQDYKLLLSKYETSNKRMAQLLEEKQYWDRAMNLANKKIETLERLCRALKERKQEASSSIRNETQSTSGSTVASSNKSNSNKTNSKMHNNAKVANGQPEPNKKANEIGHSLDLSNIDTNGQSLESNKPIKEVREDDLDESAPASVSKCDEAIDDADGLDAQNGIVHSDEHESTEHTIVDNDDKLDKVSSGSPVEGGDLDKREEEASQIEPTIVAPLK